MDTTAPLVLRASPSVVLIGTLLFASSAQADAQKVRGQILDSRARFAEGQEALGLALLAQAISDESDTDDRGHRQEGQLAGCAHRELALHFAKQGTSAGTARAKREARAALADGFTDELGLDCIVSAWEPELQAILGGPPKPEPLKDRTLPMTAYLRAWGRDLLTDSGSMVYLIDRVKKTRTPFWRMEGSPIYRSAISADGKRLMLEWEYSNAVLEVQRSPFRIRLAPLPVGPLVTGGTGPKPVDAIFPDGDDEAVLYDSTGAGDTAKNFMVWRTRFGSAEPPTKVAEIKGATLYRRPDRVVYRRFIPSGRTVVLPVGFTRESDAVVERDLKSGTERVIYRFDKVVQESWVIKPAVMSAGASQDGALTLIVNDQAAGKLLLLTDQGASGQPLVRTLPIDPKGPILRGGIQVGPDGRTVVIADPGGRAISFYDPMKDEWREVKLAQGCTTGAGAGDVAVVAFGLRQDGTLWLHRGGELLLVDGEGAQSCASLKAFVADKEPEWAATEYLFTDPDELWIGIEFGKFRKFVWIGWDELKKAARPVVP